MRLTIALLACVLFPSWTAAQVSLPRNDAAIALGWSGSEYPLGEYDRWRGSLFLSIAAGHHWSDHFKTDLEAGWTSRVDTESYQEIDVNGVETYALANYRARDLRLTIAPSYQFGRNQWVHPYIGTGVDIIHRESVLERPFQLRLQSGTTVVGRPPLNIPVPALHERETQVLVRPFLKTGVKMYASERSFFVTELKLGFASDLEHALWKLGVGFDF
jgi:hypothetical protein